MTKARQGQNTPTVIKKYANRRLYDTGRSSYVTLDDLCEMVKEGHDFVVYDAKSGADITRSVLTQIIVEQEAKGGQNLLPTSFLRNLISFYGEALQPLVPGYLEQSMDFFIKNQEQMSEHINKSLEGMRGVEKIFAVPGAAQNLPGNLEELSRQNMEMFERTMKMFNPFGGMNPYASSDEKKSGEK